MFKHTLFTKTSNSSGTSEVLLFLIYVPNEVKEDKKVFIKTIIS